MMVIFSLFSKKYSSFHKNTVTKNLLKKDNFIIYFYLKNSNYDILEILLKMGYNIKKFLEFKTIYYYN